MRKPGIWTVVVSALAFFAFTLMGAAQDESTVSQAHPGGSSRLAGIQLALPAGTITTIAGKGTQGFSGDLGKAIDAEMHSAVAVAVDPAGNVYFSDFNNNRVRKIDRTTGVVTTVAGKGTSGFSGDGGAAIGAELSYPSGLAFDASGNLYIADYGNNRVRMVSAGANVITTIAGDGVPGFNGDGIKATSARINGPSALAVDAKGNLYIADSFNDRIRELVKSTGNLQTVAGTGVGSFNGDSIAATKAQIYSPTGIVVDTAGDLYIVDAGNFRVRKVTASTGLISTVAGTGTSGNNALSAGKSTLATTVEIGVSSGIALDKQGNVYFCDSANNLVDKVEASTGFLSVVAGVGVAGFSGDGGLATAAELDGPQSLAIDHAGNIYIGDFNNYRIRAMAGGTAPGITSVSAIQAKQTQTITIGGSGFGAQGAYSGNSPYIQFNDITAQWGAGNATDAIGLAVSSWTDSQITITGLTGLYGFNTWSLNNGDKVTINVWNAQTDAGPYSCANVVVGGSASNCGVIPIAATPTFSPAAGTYNAPQTVTLSDTTTGATIYYTTDGSTPSAGSTKYTAAITVTTTETIQAIAIASGYTNSAVASATFTIVPSTPTPAPSFSPAPGTYSSAQSVTLADSATGAVIYYTTNGTTPTTSSTKYTGPITVSATETITAIAAAPGYLSSVGVQGTYTIGTPAATPTFSPAAGTYTSAQTVTIKDTTTGATVYYTTDGSTPTTASAKYTATISVGQTETINAIATATGFLQSATGTATYTINLPVAATPAFAPAAGTYTAAQTVTMSSTTTGATIYYTTDGSTPTTASAKYTAAVSVASTETLKAIAVASGYTNSAVGSATYTINLPVAATPTFTPAAGTFTAAQTVAIKTTTTGATIYYTTDGSTPTASSTKYTAAVSVGQTETINAIAVATGYSNSPVGSATYTINLAAAATPTFAPPPGTYTSVQTVTIKTTTTGATIYYTTDGSTPTTSSTKYTAAITVQRQEKIQAIAAATGYANSAVASGLYNINLPAATPTFSPAAGTYTAVQTVAISTSTPSASIYYTTDGTAPTTSSAVYTGAITVSSTETISAIATATNYSQSAVGTAAYIINLPPAGPIFTPPPGVYDGPVSVTITEVASGTTIYYTTNGNAPTSSSTKYTGPVSIFASETLEAVAIGSGGKASQITSGVYTMGYASAIINTVAGNGTAGFTGDSGKATSAELKSPSQTFVDGSGNLYIADTANARIRKVTAAGVISTVAGGGSPGGSIGDGFPATSAVLNNPSQAVLDPSGNLYIADSGNQRIRKVAAGTGLISTFAGNGTSGYAGDGGQAAAAELSGPSSLAFDSLGNLYICDSQNQLIRMVTPAGVISTYAGVISSSGGGYGGDGGPATSAHLSYPTSIAIDSSNNLYIADSNNNRIRKVNAATGIITTVAGNGTQTSGNDGLLATAIGFNHVASIALDAQGDLFLNENSYKVRMISPLGIITTVAGTVNPGYSGDGGPATSAMIGFTVGVAVDMAGNLYITDTSNNRVRKVGNSLTSAAATPVISVPSGGYTTAQTVTITDSTTNATIYYTTDGSIPSSGSTIYSGTITVSGTETLNAVAIAPGMEPSSVASATYSFPPPAPTFSPAGGTYTAVQSVSISDTAAGAAIYYTVTTASGSTIPAQYTGPISIGVTSTLSAYATAAGVPQSPTATATYTINLPPAPTPTFTPAAGTYTATQTVTIKDSASNATIYYTTDGSTPATSSTQYTAPISVAQSETLSAIAVAPGASQSAVGTAKYVLNIPTAAAPTFTPPSGTYTSTQNLVFLDSTPGAKIYYTTDGSTPTTASPYTTSGIAVWRSGSFNAIAFAPGYNPSPMVTASYVINLPLTAAPVISLPSGTYPGPQTVTITGTQGTIYYTEDGSIPTAASPVYTAPITIASTATLNAIAIAAPNFGPSPVVSATYTIKATTYVIGTFAGTGTKSFTGDSGQATSATLNSPGTIVGDNLGNLYISDTGNNRIRKVAPSGVITTIAGGGSGGLGDGGPATSATLNAPTGIAIDQAGNLYIADAGNFRIRKITAGTGAISTIAGNGTKGNNTGIGGAATSMTLNSPGGVAVDSAGNVFFTSLYNQSWGQVIKVSANTGVASLYAGAVFNVVYPPLGDGGPATAALLAFPSGLALDTADNLYIADAENNAIREVSASTGLINTVAKGSYPAGVSVDGAGRIFVADTSDEVISVASGSTQVSIAGTGKAGYSGDGGPALSAQLNNPSGVWVDAFGNVYIADNKNHVIRRATASIEPAAATPVISPDGGTFSAPQSVTIADSTPGAKIYYTTNGATPTASSTPYNGPFPVASIGTPVNGLTESTVQAIAIAPGYLQSPTASAGFTFGTVQATAPVFSVPTGTYTSALTVFITDSTWGATIYYTTDGTTPTAKSTLYAGPITVSASKTINAIATFTSGAPSAVVSASYNLVLGNPGTISTVVGTGIAGAGCNNVQNPKPTQCFLNNPGQSSVDTAGNLYFANTGNWIISEYQPSIGALWQVAGTGGSCTYLGDGFPATVKTLCVPYGVAVDPSENFYIADFGNFRVREVYVQGPNGYSEEIDTIAGSSNTVSGGSPAGEPSGIAYSVSGGVVYFSDWANNQIKFAYPGATGPNAHLLAGVAGRVGSTGDGGPATAALFNQPMGLATDVSGNVYVADSGNNKVRVINVATGIVTTYAGTGTAGFSGDTGLATQAMLNEPVALAMDPYGDLFIAEAKNNRIRMVSPAGIITTVAGNGTAGYTGDGGPATSAQLSNPQGVAVDANNNLYISDRNNQVIRLVGNVTVVPAATPTMSLKSGTYTGVQSLTISSTTAGATIYYTLDGTTPTTSSAKYTGSIQVAASEVVQAIATAPGSLQSAVGFATYNLILPLAAPPSFSPAGGTFNSAQTVTLSDTSTGAAIYYAVSTIGASTTTLTTGVTRYTGPITVSTTESISAYAIAPGFAQSAPVTVNFTINSGGPTIVTVAGTGVNAWGGRVNTVPLTSPVNQPYAAATDAAGNIYFSDTANNFIREINAQTGLITIVAGVQVISGQSGNAGYGGDGGLATSAALNSPTGIALDSAGNIYFSDSLNYRIRKITASTGIISTIVGNGKNTPGTRGGPATSVSLIAPMGLAVDAAGDLFYADYGNNSVWEMPITSNGVQLVAGQMNSQGLFPTGFNGDGLNPITAQLNGPTGVAVDGSGNVYIADSGNNRVREITGIGKLNQGENNVFYGVIGTIAGTGTAAYAGDGGAAFLASLNGPTDVKVDASGNVYISDTKNNRVRQILPTGIMRTLTGTGAATYAGDFGPAFQAAVNAPQGLALDSNANLYIVDTGNARIREVGYNDHLQTATPVLSLASGTYTTSQTLSITDATPGAVITYTFQGGNPTVYTGPIAITGSNGVSATAVAPGLWSSPVASAQYTLNLAPAATPVISVASGIYTAAQSVKITDTTPGAVIYYTTNGYPPNAQGGTVYTGPIAINKNVTLQAAASATGFSLSAVASAQYTINLPTVLYPTFNPVGGVYAAAQTVTIADATPSTTIYYTTDGSTPTSSSTKYTAAVKVSASGTLKAIGVATGLQPSGVAQAAYVIGTKAVTINTVAGIGWNGASGQNGIAAIASQLNYPAGVAVDPAGKVYFADTKNNEIRFVDLAGNLNTVTATGPDGYTQTAGFSGDGGWASQAQVNLPTGVAVDQAGNVYFADTGNNRIREIAIDGIISTVAGNGTAGFTGDGAAATKAELTGPTGLALDSAGNLYIADTGNNRIRKLTMSTGFISTVAGNGTTPWTGDGAAATKAGLSGPLGVAVDSSNNLYITDTGNGSLRKVTASTGFISTVAGTGTAGVIGSGQPYDQPSGVVVDHAGAVYFCDAVNNQCYVLNSSGQGAAPFAGNGLAGGTGDGGAPLSAKISAPMQMAVDNSNNLYFAESGDGRIRTIIP